MRVLLTLKLWTALCCVLFATQVFAVTEFKIITLQHRFAEDILPTIQPLAGSDGSVTGLQNQLIIRATPEKMAEIEQVIATLDVARKNLKITVSRQNTLRDQHDGVSVSGRKRIGNVEIGTRRFPKNAADGVTVDINSNQSNTRSNSQQYLNVVDGEHAFIHVGESVPFTQEWVVLTRRYVSAQKTTEFVDVTTGFAVHPRSIGNQIELEVTPRIAKLNQGGVIDFEELSTVVRINKGEWLDLGGIMQQKDDVSRAILSKQTGNQEQNNQLMIRVD
jgi:type II secretory pathway component GspD/PulD (secretin)